jgi:hypothetical protein
VVITIAFAAAYNTGRALRPAGAPAAAPGLVAFIPPTVTIRVPRLRSPELPPLAVPRPRRSDSDGARAIGGAARPQSDSPRTQPEAPVPSNDELAPSPSDPDQAAGPPSGDVPATPSEPNHRPGNDGDWSSGN